MLLIKNIYNRYIIPFPAFLLHCLPHTATPCSIEGISQSCMPPRSRILTFCELDLSRNVLFEAITQQSSAEHVCASLRYKLYLTDTQKRKEKKRNRIAMQTFKVIFKKFKPAVSELWVGRELSTRLALASDTHTLGTGTEKGDQDGIRARLRSRNRCDRREKLSNTATPYTMHTANGTEQNSREQVAATRTIGR